MSQRTVIHTLRRSFLALSAMVLSVVALQGCLVDTVNLDEELTCQSEGEVRGRRACQDGVWVLVDATGSDLGDLIEVGDLGDTGMMPDQGCVAESDAEICMQAMAMCGRSGERLDRCGVVRNPDCGPCNNDQRCAAGVCVPKCDAPTDQVLCDDSGAECGVINSFDSCNQELMVDCGDCNEGFSCNMINVCECIPKTMAELCVEQNAQCGVLNIDDGCGTVVNADCGACDMAGDFNCNADNMCVCNEESKESFCGRLRAQCGMVQGKNNCDETITVDCGGCANNDPCKADKTCAVCQPFSDQALCANAGLQCGTHPLTNNCGQSVSVTCNPCQNGTVCSNGSMCECPEPSCNGVACGLATNACGGSTLCTDTCNGATQQCLGNACICKPETDAQLCTAAGATCGSITVNDRCGTSRTVSCGACGGGNTCSASNTCSCPTPSCSGVPCGTVTNACGNSLVCPNMCNATTQQCSTTGNACECKPQTNAELCTAEGATCGSITVNDRCGASRTVTCGTCDATTQQCTGNTCECKPETDAQLCAAAGATCGSITVTDRCGASRTVTCGSCNATTQQCVSNACECKPQTNAELCTAEGATCGAITVTDRCGASRNVTCGSCSGGNTCNDVNVCCGNAAIKTACEAAGFCDPSVAVTACGGTISSADCSVNTCNSGPSAQVCDTGPNPDSCCVLAILDIATICNGSCDAQTFEPGCGQPTVPVDCAMACTDAGMMCKDPGNNACVMP